MNIGIDARMLGTMHGGIGRYVFELSKNLAQVSPLDDFFVFYNVKQSDFTQVDELKSLPNVFMVATKIRHYSLMEQISFHRLLNKYNLDLMHFPNFNVPLLYNKPFVVTIHDLVHHKISGHKKSRYLHFLAYKKIIQNAAQKSRMIITVSESSKKDIVKQFDVNPEKVKVTYLGASINTGLSEAEVLEVKKTFLLSKPYFLFVGVLERKKNAVNLARGFDAFITKYNLDMDLVIVGKADKHYPDIRHKILDIKAWQRLVFCGEVTPRELAALYKGAYAFASASLHEGFGLPGVEAMRFGLPLLVSNIETFNEIYDNAAVYFNPLDPEDIAEKFHLLATDKNFYSQIREHAVARSELFDWKKTAMETLEIYKNIKAQI